MYNCKVKEYKLNLQDSSYHFLGVHKILIIEGKKNQKILFIEHDISCCKKVESHFDDPITLLYKFRIVL